MTTFNEVAKRIEALGFVLTEENRMEIESHFHSARRPLVQKTASTLILWWGDFNAPQS